MYTLSLTLSHLGVLKRSLPEEVDSTIKSRRSIKAPGAHLISDTPGGLIVEEGYSQNHLTEI